MKDKVYKADAVNGGAVGVKGMLSAQVLYYAVTFMLGFVASRTSLFGTFTPFAIPAAAAAGLRYSIPAMLGGAAGHLAFGGVSGSLRYIAALLLVVMIKWAFGGAKKISGHLLFPILLSFTSCFFTGIVLGFSGGMTGSDWTILLCESIICGGSAFFFTQFFAVIENRERFTGLTQHQLGSMIAVCIIVMMGLVGFTVLDVSVGRIVSVLCILCAARYGKEAAGSILGIGLGITVGLATGNFSFFLVMYALGGLLGGLFSPIGKLGSIFGFLAAGGIGVLAGGLTPDIISGAYEFIAASILFMIIPATFEQRVGGLFIPVYTVHKTDSMKGSVIMRLDFASKALAEVAQSVETVSEKLAKIGAYDINDVYERTIANVCQKCGQRMYCWESGYNDTMDAFNALTPALRKNGEIDKFDLPDHFRNKCCKQPEFISAVNRYFCDFAAQEGAQMRLSQVRTVVSDQFTGMSDMLTELSYEIAKADRYDKRMAAAVKKALDDSRVQVLGCTCVVDKYDRMTVEVMAKSPAMGDLDKDYIRSLISLTCERSFDIPTVEYALGNCRITLNECATYKVRFGHAQRSYNGGAICGDAYETFLDARGHAMMVISDGMGRGGRAAVDGAMACSLLSRMIKAGFGFDSALKMVNSALVLKSDDETLATLDVVSLDLYTGDCEFLKAGAPASFVRHGTKIGVVESQSLPAGILRDVEFEKFSAPLADKDIVVMVSDGVVEDDNSLVTHILHEYNGNDPAELCEKILYAATRKKQEGHQDDVTVVAAFVDKGV